MSKYQMRMLERKRQARRALLAAPMEELLSSGSDYPPEVGICLVPGCYRSTDRPFIACLGHWMTLSQHQRDSYSDLRQYVRVQYQQLLRVAQQALLSAYEQGYCHVTPGYVHEYLRELDWHCLCGRCGNKWHYRRGECAGPGEEYQRVTT